MKIKYSGLPLFLKKKIWGFYLDLVCTEKHNKLNKQIKQELTESNYYNYKLENMIFFGNFTTRFQIQCSFCPKCGNYDDSSSNLEILTCPVDCLR